MKKLLRSFILIILTIVIFMLPMLLVACDKNDDDVYDENLKYYYGKYMPLDKFFSVSFKAPGTSGIYRDPYTYSIIGVKENSFIAHVFTEEDTGKEYYSEKEFDENILAEVDRWIEFMGDYIEFRKGEVYFCDSMQNLTFPPEELYFFAGDYIYSKYRDFSLRIHRWESGDVIEMDIGLPENTVQDKNGVEWEISVDRRYKKVDGE